MRSGINAREVDQKLDEVMSEQVNFYEKLLQENTNGQNVIGGKNADFLEHCIKGLMPIVRISDSKFLFGSTVRTVQIRSEKIHVQVGGGAIPLADHWRSSAVSETIKLNKLVVQQRTSVSKVIRAILEKQTVSAAVVQDFIAESTALDYLFEEQRFLTKAWSKQ